MVAARKHAIRDPHEVPDKSGSSESAKTYGPPRRQVAFVIQPKQSAKTYPAFQLRCWPRWRFAHPDPNNEDGVERQFLQKDFRTPIDR
jgi:hypothetical protein